MSRVWPISTFLLSMEFLSLSRRRSSSQNVACGEEQGQMAVIAAWFPRYQFHIPSNMKFQRKLCHIQWLPGLCHQTFQELNLFLKLSRSGLKMRLTIKVKVGIPESFKVGWYPHKITGSSHVNCRNKKGLLNFVNERINLVYRINNTTCYMYLSNI